MITTRAIDTLLQIMRDADVPTRRRIEAADALLGFEAPPEAVGQARDYLVTVFEDSEQTIPDRMDALKLARKFESPKIALPTIHTKKQETDRREWRRYEIAQRHWKLSLAIMATPPPGWADDSYSADYQPPADGWAALELIAPAATAASARDAGAGFWP